MIHNYLNLMHKKTYNNYSKNIKKDYNLLIMNNILSKGKCHIVALYKEFLLYYDYIEFLKRFYKITESRSRLINISYYFKETTIIFPNYSPLIESKYLIYNFRKKQILKNKILNNKRKLKKSKKKDKNKDKYKEINKDNNKENDNNFFSNTIYNDILDESESFLNLLFGVEKKNKDNEQINTSIIENEKEIEDFEKIIDTIHDTEVRKKRVVDLLIGGHEKNKNKKIDNKKINKDDMGVNVSISAGIKLNEKRNNIIYNNNSNSLFIKSMNNSTSSGTNSAINTIQNQKFNILYKKNNNNIKKSIFQNDKIYKKIKIDSNCISPTKNIFNNNINFNKINEEEEKKQDKIIYHRKIKSTLIGEYSYKLDLPSNLNVVNILKTANKNFFSENENKNIIRVSLYNNKKNKKIKNENTLSSSTTCINNFAKDMSVKEPKIIKIIKAQIVQTPHGKRKENAITKLTKIANSAKKIDIPYTKTPIRFFGNKINSPIYTRNHLSCMILNNSNKKSNDYTANNNNNPLLNSCKKPENIIKKIYINQNMTGPYSKPKVINKDKKYIGMSSRKSFNKSNYYIKVKSDKKEGK